MKVMIAYLYQAGDGSAYWDCYTRGKFVGRRYSHVQITLLAAENHCSKWKEVL